MHLIRKYAEGMSLQAKPPLGFLPEIYCKCLRLHSHILPSFNLPPDFFGRTFKSFWEIMKQIFEVG